MNLDNPGPGKIVLVFSLSMVMVFVGLGCLFIFTNVLIDKFPPPNRYYIGGVLVAWAVFRGANVWFKYKRMKEEENDEE